MLEKLEFSGYIYYDEEKNTAGVMIYPKSGNWGETIPLGTDKDEMTFQSFSAAMMGAVRERIQKQGILLPSQYVDTKQEDKEETKQGYGFTDIDYE